MVLAPVQSIVASSEGRVNKRCDKLQAQLDEHTKRLDEMVAGEGRKGQAVVGCAGRGGRQIFDNTAGAQYGGMDYIFDGICQLLFDNSLVSNRLTFSRLKLFLRNLSTPLSSL